MSKLINKSDLTKHIISIWYDSKIITKMTKQSTIL